VYLQGSGGIQEEAMIAETAATNKSTPNKNHLGVDGNASMEDKDIFKSYLNLRYIDEGEESTPEKKLLAL